jgi:hypothetical protein
LRETQAKDYETVGQGGAAMTVRKFFAFVMIGVAAAFGLVIIATIS